MNSINTLLASLSDSSIKQYDSSFRKWWSYSVSNDVNPYLPTVSTLLAFLQSCLDLGAGYSTLGTHRSAVSLLSPVGGDKIGENRLIVRFMRGVGKLNPPKPRYKETWDPSLVLAYLTTLEPIDSISLEHLSLKLIMLLALATGQRQQTLHAIDIRNIQQAPGGIQIKVEKLLKTSKPGSIQPCIFLPRFESQMSLCVARTLEEYLKRTLPFRNENKNQLFLGYTGSHEPISTQTMSRWLKAVMTSSGINSDIFSAHSTRHASTSAAARSGVSVDQIFTAAGWSPASSSFSRFLQSATN